MQDIARHRTLVRWFDSTNLKPGTRQARTALNDRKLGRRIPVLRKLHASCGFAKVILSSRLYLVDKHFYNTWCNSIFTMEEHESVDNFTSGMLRYIEIK